jgi:hypothetical protein
MPAMLRPNFVLDDKPSAVALDAHAEAGLGVVEVDDLALAGGQDKSGEQALGELHQGSLNEIEEDYRKIMAHSRAPMCSHL